MPLRAQYGLQVIRMPQFARLLVIVFTALASHAMAQGGAMRITSASFADGGPMPALNADSRRCGGQDLSPQVSWHDVPRGTRSVVVLMTDAQDGAVHWIAYDIASPQDELRQGEAGASTVGVTVGRNSEGTPAYRGACAASGSVVLTVIASDLAPDALPPGLGAEDVLKAQQGHELERRSITAIVR